MSNVRNLMDQYRDELDKKYGVQESTPDFLDIYKDRFAQWETNRINRENQLRQQKVQSTISNVNDNSYETVKNNENNYGKNKENKLMGKTDNFIKGIGFADKILQTGDYIGNQMVARARERVKAKEELDKLKNTPIQKMNKDELNDYWKTLNNLEMQTNRGTALDKLFVNATKDVDITKNSYATEAQKQITAQAREEMTKDMGAVGKFVTEGLWSGTDMALTAGASAVTGIPFLAMQGGMSGAQSGQEALSKGYDAQTAGALAIGSGTITAGVESFGGIAGKWGDKIFKNKAVQSLTNKLPQKAVDYISKISSTKAGQIFGDMASEGLEEIAEYDLQRIYQNLILDEDTPRDVKEQLYAGAQGAFVGGLFGGGKAILNKNNVQSNVNDNTTVENKENISLQTNASEQSETNNIIKNQKEVILKAQQDTQLDNKAKVIESAFEKVSEANFQNETEMINAVEKLSNETGNKVSIIENERIPKTIISDGNKNIFLNMSNYRTIDNNNSETYNEEKGGGENAIEENRSPISSGTQNGEVYRRERDKDRIFRRGLSENQRGSRILFEASGATTQRGRGERKTREINGDELSYNLTPEEEINENVYKAVKGLRDIGIETDVYSGDIYINGNPRQKTADATTVSDEFILVNNNAELSAEEMIAHEGFHYHYNKGNKQAIEYQRLYQQIKTYAEGNSHLKDYAERVMLSYTDPLSPAYNSVVDENGNVNQDILSEEVLAKLCEEVIQDPVSFIEKTKKNNNIITVIQDLLRKIKNNLAIKLTNSEKARLDNALLEIEKYMRGVSDGNSKVKSSIYIDTDGNPYVKIDKDILEGVPEKDWLSVIKNALETRKIDMGAFDVIINSKTRGEYARSKYTEGLLKNDKIKYKDKIRALNNIDEIVQNAYNIRNEDSKHNNFPSYNRAHINIEIGEKQYSVEVLTGVARNNYEVLYDIVNIKPTKIKRSPPFRLPKKAPKIVGGTSFNKNISQDIQNINSNNLLENGRNITDSKKSINIIEKSDKQKDFKGLSIEESIEKISQSGVTAKSADVQRKAENTLVKSISNAFGVSYADKQGVIKDMVKEISKQIKQTGKIDNTSIDNLMNIAFNKGKIIDDNFSKQYNSLKKELRETKFKYTPTEVFQDMRKKYFGKLAFSKDGIDVDILYKEFSENYPELFSSSIVNPEDQIVRIGEVYDKLAEKEISLDKYYGESSDEFKEYIKQDLQYAINKYVKELNQVEKFEKDNRRIILEKEQRKANYKPMTQEEYKSAQKKVYNAQKAYDKVIKDILLTEKEKKLVDTLINGGDPNLVTGDNRNEILAVYSAKKALEDAKKPITQYKKEITETRNDRADDVLKTFRGWKDKKIGLAYSTETFERNIRDIVPDGKVAQSIIDTYISPIHKSEAESNRLKNSLREKIRALKLDMGNKKRTAICCSFLVWE